MPTLTGNTFSGFTRPSDPIAADQLATKISTDIGKTVTIVVTPTDVLVTGLTLVTGDGTAIQTSMSAYNYVPLQFPLNAAMYADDDGTMAANSGTRVPTQRAVKAYLNGKRRTYVDGVPQNGTAQTGDIVEWIDTATTVSGVAVYNLTDTYTSGGNAICTSIYADSIQSNFIDSTGVYAQGSPTIAASKKTISIPFTKQGFNGVTVLGINVLGAVAMATIPDGVTVKMISIGIV